MSHLRGTARQSTLQDQDLRRHDGGRTLPTPRFVVKVSTTRPTSLLGRLHREHVFHRRVRVLSREIAQVLPRNARVLDVGCGDGLMASFIQQRRPDVSIVGIDVLVRPDTHIPVTKFDGSVIPYADRSFDAVMFVDVLHHTENPDALLREAGRVAREIVVIKDHYRNGFLAGATLRLMDWVGNARHGVVLPYNYWPRDRWNASFRALGLKVTSERRRMGLYPRPATWLFDRSLHFVSRLEVGSKPQG